MKPSEMRRLVSLLSKFYSILGDWEMEHEKFVMEFDAAKLPPSPRNIPKIWETTELSDFWSAGDLEVSQAYDPVSCVIFSFTLLF